MQPYLCSKPSPTPTFAVTAKLPLLIATLLWPYRGAAVDDVQFTLDGQTAIVAAADAGEVRVTSASAR